MTLNHTSQVESDLQAKILELLIFVVEEYKFSNRRIAELLGVNENHLSRVKSGKAKSSPQFLAALKLLVRVIELEERAALQEEELRIKQRIAELKGASPHLNERLQQYEAEKLPASRRLIRKAKGEKK